MRSPYVLQTTEKSKVSHFSASDLSIAKGGTARSSLSAFDPVLFFISSRFVHGFRSSPSLVMVYLSLVRSPSPPPANVFVFRSTLLSGAAVVPRDFATCFATGDSTTPQRHPTLITSTIAVGERSDKETPGRSTMAEPG